MISSIIEDVYFMNPNIPYIFQKKSKQVYKLPSEDEQSFLLKHLSKKDLKGVVLIYGVTICKYTQQKKLSWKVGNRFRGEMYFDKVGTPIKSTIIKYS